MVDLSWAHILVVVVVALVVVGPKDLPRLMRAAGKWAGKARAMADSFRKSFDDIARESEMQEMRAEMNRLSEATARQPMTDDDYKSFGIDPDTLTPRPESASSSTATSTPASTTTRSIQPPKPAEAPAPEQAPATSEPATRT